MTRTRIPAVLVVSCAIAVSGGRVLGGADDAAQLLRQIPADLPLSIVVADLEKLDLSVTSLVKTIGPNTAFEGLVGTLRKEIGLADWIDFTKPIALCQIEPDQKDASLVWAVVPNFKEKVGAVEGAVEEEGVWKIPFEGKGDVYARTDGAFVVSARSKEFLARAKAEEGSLGDSAEWRLDLLRKRGALLHLQVEPYRSTAKPLGKMAHGYAALIAGVVRRNQGTDPRVLTGFLTAWFDAADKFLQQLKSIDLAVSLDNKAIQATIATVYRNGPVKKYLAKQKPATERFFTEIEAQSFMLAFAYHVPGEESPFFDYVCDIVKKSTVPLKGMAATPPGDGVATAESLRKATEITRGFLRRLEGMNMVLTGSSDGFATSGDYGRSDASAMMDLVRKMTVTPGSFLRPLSGGAAFRGLASRDVGDVTVEEYGVETDPSNPQIPLALQRYGDDPRKAFAIIRGRVRHYTGCAKNIDAAFADRIDQPLAGSSSVKQALAALPDRRNAVLLFDPLASYSMFLQATGNMPDRAIPEQPLVALSVSLAGEPARVDLHVPIGAIRLVSRLAQVFRSNQPQQPQQPK